MTFNETMASLYDVCGGYASRTSWKGRWIWMECYSSDLEDHVLFMEFFNRGITDYSPSDEDRKADDWFTHTREGLIRLYQFNRGGKPCLIS